MILSKVMINVTLIQVCQFQYQTQSMAQLVDYQHRKQRLEVQILIWGAYYLPPTFPCYITGLIQDKSPFVLHGVKCMLSICNSYWPGIYWRTGKFSHEKGKNVFLISISLRVEQAKGTPESIHVQITPKTCTCISVISRLS